MQSKTAVFFGGAGTLVFMILALWTWQNAEQIADDWGRPRLALWSVRSAAISAAALAQGLLLTLVVGGVYRRDLPGDVLRVLAAAVFTVGAVGAVVFGMAGR